MMSVSGSFGKVDITELVHRAFLSIGASSVETITQHLQTLRILTNVS